MPRLLAIDYGKARLGVAISDARQIVATPLCTIENKKGWEGKLQDALKQYGTFEAVVLGLPLLMNGKESEMTQMVRQFSVLLEKALGLPVIFWDERLTSAQVERSMRDAGMKRKKRAEVSDPLAALLILQSYLEFKTG